MSVGKPKQTVLMGRAGWVYLIHAIGTDRYKIGRSIRPSERYTTLQKQSPYPIEMIANFWSPDAIADETELHKDFVHRRAFGEWFELDGVIEDSLIGETWLRWCLDRFEIFRPTALRYGRNATKLIADTTGLVFDPTGKDPRSLISSASITVLEVDFNRLFHAAQSPGSFSEAFDFAFNDLPSLIGESGISDGDRVYWFARGAIEVMLQKIKRGLSDEK